MITKLIKPAALFAGVLFLSSMVSCSGCSTFVRGMADNYNARGISISNLDNATYGDSIVSERQFAGVPKIEVESPMHIRVFQSATPRLVITAPSAERAERFICRVEDGELHLREEGIGKIDAKKDGIFLVEVYTPDIQKIDVSTSSLLVIPEAISADKLSIELSGASTAKVYGTLTTREMELDASGASNIILALLEASKLDVDASGASRITVTGKAERLEADCSGASGLDLVNLSAVRASLDCSGASSAKLRVTEELSYEVSGASSLRYHGTPRITKSEVSGASSAKAIED